MTKKRILTYVGYSLLITGWIGFGLGILISVGTITYNSELPLGGIEGFVVDGEKNIYVGIGYFSKVQMYDSQGHFVRHWSIQQNTNGGAFNINLKNGKDIVISAARSDSQTIYDKYGKILESKRIRNIYEKTIRDYKVYTNVNGNKYKLNDFLFTKVLMTSPKHKTIVCQNQLLESLIGPRVWFIGLIGLLVLLFNKNISFNLTS